MAPRTVYKGGHIPLHSEENEPPFAMLQRTAKRSKSERESGSGPANWPDASCLVFGMSDILCDLERSDDEAEVELPLENSAEYYIGGARLPTQSFEDIDEDGDRAATDTPPVTDS